MEMQEFLCPCGAVLQVSPSFTEDQIVCSSCNTLLQIQRFPDIDQEVEIENQKRKCSNCNYIGYELSCPYCFKEMQEIVVSKKKFFYWLIPFLTFVFGFFIGILL
ncbi:MAG: hypothetical protein HUU50_01630 [Candidatus Brocadiae bacterium]|nr:hypothetical protein [Candidatus Brocadiia bacterium]